MHYKATIIKAVCYWHKTRQINRWNEINNPELRTWPMKIEGSRISREGMDYSVNAIRKLGYLGNSPFRSSSHSNRKNKN